MTMKHHPCQCQRDASCDGGSSGSWVCRLYSSVASGARSWSSRAGRVQQRSSTLISTFCAIAHHPAWPANPNWPVADWPRCFSPRLTVSWPRSGSRASSCDRPCPGARGSAPPWICGCRRRVCCRAAVAAIDNVDENECDGIGLADPHSPRLVADVGGRRSV